MLIKGFPYVKCTNQLCLDIIDYMALGNSEVRARKKFKITPDQWKHWKSEKPLFTEAVGIGLDAQEAYWEEELTIAAIAKKGSCTAMMFYMKSQFTAYRQADTKLIHNSINLPEKSTIDLKECSLDDLQGIITKTITKEYMSQKVEGKKSEAIKLAVDPEVIDSAREYIDKTLVDEENKC